MEEEIQSRNQKIASKTQNWLDLWSDPELLIQLKETLVNGLTKTQELGTHLSSNSEILREDGDADELNHICQLSRALLPRSWMEQVRAA